MILVLSRARLVCFFRHSAAQMQPIRPSMDGGDFLYERRPPVQVTVPPNSTTHGCTPLPKPHTLVSKREGTPSMGLAWVCESSARTPKLPVSSVAWAGSYRYGGGSPKERGHRTAERSSSLVCLGVSVHNSSSDPQRGPQFGATTDYCCCG